MTAGVRNATPKQEPTLLTITPFLWFETQAEEAMNYYASIFPRAKKVAVNRAGDAVMSVVFELEGQKFMALNGRQTLGFNDSVSFFVGCETQQEIDALWERLTADGGTPGQCGWLKDKFALSWQIIPNSLGQLLGGGGDPGRSKRVVDAMLQMKKLDAGTLQAAYDGA
jgi:predicted 3-demethylubiquinone-9 3-methyltransferase (glyoxalase superfamily)